MAKENTMENMAAIFQVCWAIWKARNACVFTGKGPIPGETIEAAFVSFRDYLQDPILPNLPGSIVGSPQRCCLWHDR
ncbi:hypothetical protein RHMOL_Rhmol01G0039700 [Rhododendron molle]|uniref:Uncharacterized protein n=1 Tax=Rhododendron molle TaxID=49168 RepID=A0ACC0PY71_RHOML|nr:hypothetical protein RHMOL_Rhmol01G0039700 [Rhododendron molle]